MGGEAMNELRWRRAGAAAVVVAAVAALFVLAPVRGAAAQFLALFRVEEIRTVPFDPGSMEGLAATGFDPADFVTVVGDPMDGEPRTLATVGEAAAELPYALRRPAALGAPDEVVLVPAGRTELSVDGARLHDALAGLGLDASAVPPEQAVIEVERGAAVGMRWTAADGEVELLQVPAPEIALPDGWDPAALGRLYLGLLGRPDDEVDALAETIDWATTLVVPVPMGHVESVPVRVDGAEGVLFLPDERAARRMALAQPPAAAMPVDRGPVEVGPGRGRVAEAGGAEALLLWQRDGLVYALSGERSGDELVALAADFE
jgi:hypothetical protein